jgi:raffinose/stachyose/melibiose transport system substrate-binding protein
MDLSTLSMIPYYCGVEGEEKAGLNCGTENYWAINGDASEEDIQATIDFMVWLVTDPEASEAAVGTFGVMPYKSAAVSTNPFLAQANAYLGDGCYNMAWITNFQPNVDAYRATAVAALNAYNADPSDANWATVVTAFIDGWAVQYQAVNG